MHYTYLCVEWERGRSCGTYIDTGKQSFYANHDLNHVYHSHYVFWYIDKWRLDCPSHFLSLWSPSTDKRPGFQIQTGPQRTKECAYAVLAVFMYSVLFLHLDCSWICFHCLPPAIAQNGVNATALAIQRGHTEVVRDLLDKFGASLRLARKGLVCRLRTFCTLLHILIVATQILCCIQFIYV